MILILSFNKDATINGNMEFFAPFILKVPQILFPPVIRYLDKMNPPNHNIKSLIIKYYDLGGVYVTFSLFLLF